MMALQEFLLDPASLGLRAPASWQPLGCINLDACPASLRIGPLPPFPLVGIGDPAHPLARNLDAVIEPPVSTEQLIDAIVRNPHAAGVAAQLLRSADGLPYEHALTLESIAFGLLQGSAEHAAWLAAHRPVTHPLAAGRVGVERRPAELLIVLDRPQARNAIDVAMRDSLLEALTVARLDPEVRCIKLRATGAAFSAGGDLHEFGTTRDPATAHVLRSRSLPARLLAECRDRLDVHVQGACIGAGLEMAAFATKLTAAPDAWFQLPELAMGLIPGAGGCVSVPRRIGRQRAALMILSGACIDAETARRWGLIDAIGSAQP